MAVDANGRPDGQSNGYIKSEPKSRSGVNRSVPRKRGFIAWSTSQIIRALVWYTIGTIILRCPKELSDLSEESPRLCKPYLQFHSFASPYVQPYYATHIEPHLERVQPYIDYANDKFVRPASSFAESNYNKYGAPLVENAQTKGKEQWDKVVVPQLTLARGAAGKQYDAILAPHVQKVDGLVRPYYTRVATSAQDFWELELQPAYKIGSPYVRKAYDGAERFALEVVVPYSQWANGLLWTSMNRHVLPTLQVLYGENVEPQIMRIKQRLGRYRDEKKVEAAVNSAESSTTTSTSSSTESTLSSTTSTSTVASTVASSTIESFTEASVAPAQSASAAELFGKDLDLWELQVQKAVEEGTEHLKERIADICSEQTAHQVRSVGDSLVIQLEELESHSSNKLRKAIQSTASDLPEDVTEEDVTKAHKDIEAKLRAAGKQLREKAEQIRAWRKNFDIETTDLVEAAANSTLETVDNIRDLRLHDIGRRWASHDGITHRDWARYNQLKKTSGHWRDSIVDLVTKNDDLSAARASAAEVEERAMAVVVDAANELARLKGVALWKFRARDDSDDFENKMLPPIMAKVKEQAAEAVSGISEAIMGSSTQGTVESATSQASSFISEASEAVVESFVAASEALSASADPILSAASSVSKSILKSSISSAASAASVLSEKILGSASDAAHELPSEVSKSVVSASSSILSGDASIVHETASSLSSVAADMQSRGAEEVESIKSEASKSAEAEASAASESVISIGASASSFDTDVPISAASSIADAVISSVSSLEEEVTSLAGEEASVVSSKVASATSRVFAGAMAQAVPEQKPVFDEPLDAEDEEGFFDDLLSSGWQELTSMTKAVEEAIYGKTASGAQASATRVASDIYQSALDAASSIFYGAKPTGNSAARFASEKYDDAVSAASQIIYGKPTPALEGAALTAQSYLAEMSSQASSKFSEALAYASSQSAMAKSRVSEQISGTPKPVHEQMFASVESAYADASSRAAAKYQSFVAPTTSFALPTGSPYESVSSVASARLSAALSAASAQYSKAKIAVGVESTPVPQSILNEAQRRYYEGIGYAYDQYSSYVESASKAIRSAGVPFIPTTTPAYQALVSSAQVQYALASAAASSALAEALASASSVAGVKTTTPAQSVLDAASEQYSSAMARASTMLYGTQTPAYESMIAVASSRYQDVISGASESYDSLMSAARSAAGAETTGNSVFQNAAEAAASQYSAALLAAQSAYSQVSSDASQAVYGTSTHAVASASSAFSAYIYGTEPAWTEQMASQAAANWEAVVGAASERIYGQPTPYYAAFVDQASGAAAQVTSVAASAAAQATSAANDHYSAVASLLSSLVSGKEADFTDRVFSQFSSAYYTGAPAAVSAASSAAAGAYSDAASAVSAMFTPPAAIEDILASVTAQLDAAVSAASEQVYGTEPGTVEKATSAAASVASDAASGASSVADQVSSKISQAVYGTPAPYFQQAQSNIALTANNAVSQVYSALFSPAPEPVASQASSGANAIYESAASVAGDTYSAASSVAEDAASRVSELVFGAERTGALESARKRIEEAVESARVQIEGFAGDAGSAFAQGTSMVKDTAASAASGASSVASSVSKRMKDEL